MDEKRVFYILLSILAGFFLLQQAWSFIGLFSDIILLIVLSWLLAFILEPIVKKLTIHNLSRPVAAGIVYAGLTILLTIIGVIVIPTVISQLTVLAHVLPPFFATAPEWAARFQTFVTTTLSNSVVIAQSIAATFLNLLLVLVFSFYFLVERESISKTIFNILPDEWEDEYKFLEKVINTSFAGFLRVQVVLGIIVAVTTFVVLLILRVNYALSASVAAGILAIIPVVGPVLAVIPAVLTASLISINTGLITFIILFLLQQIIYNVISPKIIGDTLKLHPIFVLLSFVVGYKIGGTWGAVFAVPVTSALVIVVREFLDHWQKT
ncbi:MAG: AI-2E family transporter [bacterium]|nr:AI-2E family transporter [bacterium]